MTASIATKQYKVNQLPDDPSQITTGSFTDVGPGGTITISYFVVGKLYFGFQYLENSVGQMSPIIGGLDITTFNNTISRMATKLGITVNTTYRNPNLSAWGTDALGYYDPSGSPTWVSYSGGATIYSLYAILAN